MGCVLVNVKGPKIAQEERDHAPNFPLKHAQKARVLLRFPPLFSGGRAAWTNAMALATARGAPL
eukprot:11975346-Prorocentrum_lima.AAC.1